MDILEQKRNLKTMFTLSTPNIRIASIVCKKLEKSLCVRFFFAVAILSASQTFIHSLQTSSRYTNNNLIFILNLNSTERPTNFGPTTHNSNAVKVFVTL